MAKFYLFEKKSPQLLKGKFGEQAQNDAICAEADTALAAMVESGELAGGPVIKFDGPASLPLVVVIAHRLGHLYGVVAIRDPKMFVRGQQPFTFRTPEGEKTVLTRLDEKGQPVPTYVVGITHSPDYKVGDLID